MQLILEDYGYTEEENTLWYYGRYNKFENNHGETTSIFGSPDTTVPRFREPTKSGFPSDAMYAKYNQLVFEYDAHIEKWFVLNGRSANAFHQGG